MVIVRVQENFSLLVHLEEQMPHLDKVLEGNLLGDLNVVLIPRYHIKGSHIVHPHIVLLHPVQLL